MEIPKLLYTPNEAAAILGVSRQTIYNAVNDGRLEAVKIGARLRIKAKSIDAFLARRAHQEPRRGTL